MNICISSNVDLSDIQCFNNLYYEFKNQKKKYCDEQIDIINKYYQKNILYTLAANNEYKLLETINKNDELFKLVTKYLMQERIKTTQKVFDYGTGNRFFKKVYEKQNEDISKFVKNFDKIISRYVKNFKENKEYIESLIIMYRLTA